MHCSDEHRVCTADLAEYAERWANDGKHVLVSALDATFQRKPFMTVLELIPLAETVTKLTAVCSDCHKSASFTKRLTTETGTQVGARLYSNAPAYIRGSLLNTASYGIHPSCKVPYCFLTGHWRS